MNADAARRSSPLSGLFEVFGRIAFAAAMEYKRRADEPELALLPRLLRPDRAFLDVGANVGLYSYVARRRASQIYAVEPHPRMAAALRRNFAGDVEVLEFALSDHEGAASLHVPEHEGGELTSRSSLEAEANPGFDEREVEVELHRLDGLTLPPLGLVKIDVEGHEKAVLLGAEETLARDRPALIVEIEERHHPGESARIFALLGGWGYDGFFLESGRLRPIAGFDPKLHQRPEEIKRPGSKRATGYINNFIFVPSDDAGLRERLLGSG